MAYDADIGRIFDTRDADALAAQSMTPDRLAGPDWRRKTIDGERAPSQDFASNLIDSGYAGLLVRSYAPGAALGELNLVLWRWNTGESDRLALIDDEKRFLP